MASTGQARTTDLDVMTSPIGVDRGTRSGDIKRKQRDCCACLWRCPVTCSELSAPSIVCDDDCLTLGQAADAGHASAQQPGQRYRQADDHAAEQQGDQTGEDNPAPGLAGASHRKGEEDAQHAADDQRAEGMHHVRPRAHGDETGQRAVVDEARVAIARDQLGLDALRSAIVLFVNRGGSRCKHLFHDGSGLVILYKRLDAGRFHLPAAVLAGDRSVRIEPRELALLLAGAPRR